MKYQCTDIRTNLVKAIEESRQNPVKIVKYSATVAVLISYDHWNFIQRLANAHYYAVANAAKKEKTITRKQGDFEIAESVDIADHEQEIVEYVRTLANGVKRSGALKVDLPGSVWSKNFETWVLLFSKSDKVVILGIIEKS